jgi:putative endopeptidase
MLHRLNYFLKLVVAVAVVFVVNESATAQISHGSVNPADFDTTVKPSVDFFRYVNGGWLARNPIPEDQSLWGSFLELQEHNYAVLHDILEASARNKAASSGSAEGMVGNFYASGMDTDAIEAAHVKPLAEEFKMISSLKDRHSLEAAIAHLHSLGVGVPFNFSANQDEKKSTVVVGHIHQSGLGLPDRDYYTKEDNASKKIREQYSEHMKRMFMLLGDDSTAAAAEAVTVMGMETAMARASMTRVERRDPEATYHKMSASELASLCPSLSWDRYFTGLGIPNPENVIVGMPGFMKKIDTMLTATPVGDWQTYFRWHLIRATAEYLDAGIVKENFHFNGQILTGVKEMRPRWKRVLDAVNRGVGEDLGQLYVAKAFTPEAKARAKVMVMNLKAALHDRIEKLEWMSDATKQQAFKKLDAFGVKIGYPDLWRDYTALKIDRASYLGNVLASRNFEFHRNLGKIGKPVDRTEWGMTPPTVNAYYSPTMNEIVFPAGILQPPFYDPNADDAVNYGGMGAVIGHEMTHGFDDQGRKFDAVGNLTDWWTSDDGKNFSDRAALVEKQFSGYAALDTLHVNGKLTLGENIADLGGLKIAYEAFEKTIQGKPRPPLVDGFTPEQRFFLSWAVVWRVNIRPEALRVRLNTDPHSPGRFRCNGPLSNMKEFFEAFHVDDGSPMARPVQDRARIW